MAPVTIPGITVVKNFSTRASCAVRPAIDEESKRGASVGGRSRGRPPTRHGSVLELLARLVVVVRVAVVRDDNVVLRAVALHESSARGALLERGRELRRADHARDLVRELRRRLGEALGRQVL